MITEDQLEQLAIHWFLDTGWNYVHGAMIAPVGLAAEREDFRAVVLKGRLAARRRDAMPGQVLDVVTKPENPIGRPFRAWESMCDGTQGVALGCRLVPRWGGRIERNYYP